MSRVKFLVDTGSDIPQSYIDKYDVTVVPLTINIEDKSSKDFYELDGIEFAQYLRTCKTIPTTSQPSPVEFLEHFNKFAPDYDHIICFAMAPAGSGTYNSACLGKGMYDESNTTNCTVHVIDSKSCSLVEVLELEEAGDLLNAGESVEKVLEVINDTRERVATFYLVDNVEFLIKGGRVSVVKGKVASKLNLKPIVAIRGGEGSVLTSALGYKKGMEKLVQYYREEAVDNAKLYVSHTDCEDKAKSLIALFKESYPNLEYVLTNMFCTMATQAGPDTVAIFYKKKNS